MKRYILIPITLIAGLSLLLSCKEKNPLDITNHPPEITLFTYQQTMRVGSEASIVLETVDLDRDSITVTTTVEKGRITWTKQVQTVADITKLHWEGTYRPDTVGSTSIDICVSDGMKEKTYTYPVTVVVNVPPHAQYVCSLLTQTAPYIVQFDASASYDPDGEIVSYLWDFGDTIAQGQVVAHQFPNAEEYSIALVVEDSEGLTDTLIDTLVFTNQKPHPVIQAPITEAYAPCTLWFDGRDSYDEDGRIISWTWEWGDETEDSHKDADWHIFEDQGNYSVSLRIIDNAHAESTATIAVTVNPSPPCAVMELHGSLSPHTGGSGTFKGIDSYDPDGEIANWRWELTYPDFSDAILSDGPLDSTQSCPWRHVGTHQIKLVIQDNDSLQDSTTMFVTVQNYNPIAVITVIDTSDHPHADSLKYTFGATNSSDIDPHDILTYAWSCTDGGSGTSSAFSRTFVRSKLYVVILQVTDPHGGTSIDTYVIDPSTKSSPPVGRNSRP
jgi:PKD repeat protein